MNIKCNFTANLVTTVANGVTLEPENWIKVLDLKTVVIMGVTLGIGHLSLKTGLKGEGFNDPEGSSRC